MLWNAALVVGAAVIWAVVKRALSMLYEEKGHIKSLAGKHVCVTGGSSGIGLALALRCAAEGAFVTLMARSPAKLAHARDLLCSSLHLSSDSVLIKAVDVSNAEAVATAIRESSEWKPMDVLVCCAGQATMGLLDDTKVSFLDITTRTNLLGCVFPIHAAIPLMKARSLHNPSSIVIMSSSSALISLYASNAYTPTKCALKGLAEMLSFELLPWNIKVTLACPGFTDTPMLKELAEAEGSADMLELVEKMYVISKESDLEHPEEVARQTVEGMKRGDFLVTTTAKGFLVGILARGMIPPDSLFIFLVELMLLIPMRLVSVLWVFMARRAVHENYARQRK